MFLFLEIYSTTLMHFCRYLKKMNYFRGFYSLLTFIVCILYILVHVYISNNLCRVTHWKAHISCGLRASTLEPIEFCKEPYRAVFAKFNITDEWNVQCLRTMTMIAVYEFSHTLFASGSIFSGIRTVHERWRIN